VGQAIAFSGLPFSVNNSWPKVVAGAPGVIKS